MLDSDLAVMYGVETKVFNQAVKRNLDRFPENFRFQLTEDEVKNLRSQFVTSSAHGGRRYLPYAFSEPGVAMLASILRSETAVRVSIAIINAFVEMRKFLSNNAAIFQRIERVEKKQVEIDDQFKQIFNALEEKSVKAKQGIFYKGEIYDAYTLVCDLIREAKNSIILVDNYIDDTVLTLLSKRNKGVSAKIYTENVSKELKLDLHKHNSQYPFIEISEFKEAHDRFLIIDEKELYHFGASLKDLGRKWFAFSEMHSLTNDILIKLKNQRV